MKVQLKPACIESVSVAKTKKYKLLHFNLVSKHSGWNGENKTEIKEKKKGGDKVTITAHLTVKEQIQGTIQHLLENFTAPLKNKFGMRQDTSAIWTHLSPVVSHFKVLIPSLNTLHMISDGPTTQYCSKKNYFCLSSVPFQLGFKKVTWNFLEAGHGKAHP